MRGPLLTEFLKAIKYGFHVQTWIVIVKYQEFALHYNIEVILIEWSLFPTNQISSEKKKWNLQRSRRQRNTTKAKKIHQKRMTSWNYKEKIVTNERETAKMIAISKMPSARRIHWIVNSIFFQLRSSIYSKRRIVSNNTIIFDTYSYISELNICRIVLYVEYKLAYTQKYILNKRNSLRYITQLTLFDNNTHYIHLQKKALRFASPTQVDRRIAESNTQKKYCGMKRTIVKIQIQTHRYTATHIDIRCVMYVLNVYYTQPKHTNTRQCAR